MADREHLPGSRAIRIPLKRTKDENFSTPSCRRSDRDNRMQRTDSTDGSDGASSTASSSRTRDMILGAHKTIASPSHMNIHSTTSTPDRQPQRKDKQRASPPSTVPTKTPSSHSWANYSSPLGPGMLSSSSYKSINLNSGDPDEPSRLITYTKHSQGFTWNDELFLPSYLMGRRYGGRGGKARRRWGYDDEDDDMDGVGDFDEEVDRCPVTDIFVTDEEAAAMMP